MCVVGARALSTRGRGFLLPARSGRTGDGVLVGGGLPKEESVSTVQSDPAQLDRRMVLIRFYPSLAASSSRGRDRVRMHKSPPPKSGGYPVYPEFMPCHAVGVLATGHDGREISRAAA